MVNQQTVSPSGFDVNRRRLVATAALAEAATRMARALDRHASQFGLSDAKLQLIGVLSCADGCRACLYTLGDELGVSRPNVTKLVDGLERDGLVERRPHPSDRRMVYARLTPAGERVAREALPGRAEVAGELWSDVSDQDIERLLETLESVTAHG
jgi:DNA-binding MarR family transcriptional regulator